MPRKQLLQRISRHLTRSIAAPILATALTACGQSFTAKTSSATLAEDIQDTLTCKDARSQIFDAYYKAYQNQSETSLAPLNDDADFAPGTSSDIKEAVKNIHTLLTTDLEKVSVHADSESSDESNDPVLKLIRLEMGSRIDPEYEELNAKLDVILSDAVGKAKLAKLDCETASTPTPTPTPTATPAETASRLPASLSGARYTMATAYQSCSAIQLAPMTSSTESVEGVEKGDKIDSVGYGREYTSISDIRATHYYYKGQTYGSGCTDYYDTPLVYDYGGRPIVKSSSQISLFENSGGGGALGIDCSAFISSAVGVAGLRYKPGTENKAVYTRYTSRDFISASSSGWTCYENVSVGPSASIKSGDIVAVEGHVVMVDETSDDPFGLDSVTSSSDCDSLSYKDFDFSVIQSSPSKNSIGINRYKASVYLAESSKMQTVFLAYAKAECKAKFNGETSSPSSSSYGIIRHKGTDECKAPALSIVGESCIKSCSLE